MEKFTFHKYSNQGNDFIIIDNWDNQISEKEMAKTVKFMCRPKFGVGADGVVFINSGSDDVDFAWQFFNADGSESDFSGSAALCTAHLAAQSGIAPDEMSFKSKAGVVEAWVDGSEVKVLFPKVGRSEGAALLEQEGTSLTYHRLNFITPQAVAVVDDLEKLNVVKIGRAVRRHTAFTPDGTNVNFLKVLGPDRLSVRTFERGVEDEVLASGTGAVVAALLAAAQGLVTEETITCQTKSGDDLIVTLEGSLMAPEKVFLTAKVRYLFAGEVEPDMFLK